jgi:hypothetical protein
MRNNRKGYTEINRRKRDMKLNCTPNDMSVYMRPIIINNIIGGDINININISSDTPKEEYVGLKCGYIYK